MIKKIYNSIRNRFIWLKVLSHAEKSDYFSAKQNFSKMIGYHPGGNPEFELMKAMLDFHLEENIDSLGHLKIFRNSLNRSKDYNMEEKNYLHCYADRMLYVLKKKIKEADGLSFFGDFNQINKKAVNSSLKLSFPLTLENREVFDSETQSTK